MLLFSSEKYPCSSLEPAENIKVLFNYKYMLKANFLKETVEQNWNFHKGGRLQLAFKKEALTSPCNNIIIGGNVELHLDTSRSIHSALISQFKLDSNFLLLRQTILVTTYQMPYPQFLEFFCQNKCLSGTSCLWELTFPDHFHLINIDLLILFNMVISLTASRTTIILNIAINCYLCQVTNAEHHHLSRDLLWSGSHAKWSEAKSTQLLICEEHCMQSAWAAKCLTHRKLNFIVKHYFWCCTDYQLNLISMWIA